ncbi:MAG: ATPase, partial [Nitrospirota bacterium]
MYEGFFGLESRPFSKTPDPRFLFFSKSHEEAFAR